MIAYLGNVNSNEHKYLIKADEITTHDGFTSEMLALVVKKGSKRDISLAFPLW